MSVFNQTLREWLLRHVISSNLSVRLIKTANLSLILILILGFSKSDLRLAWSISRLLIIYPRSQNPRSSSGRIIPIIVSSYSWQLVFYFTFHHVGSDLGGYQIEIANNYKSILEMIMLTVCYHFIGCVMSNGWRTISPHLFCFQQIIIHNSTAHIVYIIIYYYHIVYIKYSLYYLIFYTAYLPFIAMNIYILYSRFIVSLLK